MNLLDKLDFLMSENDLNKNTLSQKSGIPYSTIDSLYKKGFENIKLSTLKGLAEALNVSLDFLVRDDASDLGTTKNAPGTSPEGKYTDIIELLHQLTPEQRAEVKGYINRILQEKREAPPRLAMVARGGKTIQPKVEITDEELARFVEETEEAAQEENSRY